MRLPIPDSGEPTFFTSRRAVDLSIHLRKHFRLRGETLQKSVEILPSEGDRKTQRRRPPHHKTGDDRSSRHIRPWVPPSAVLSAAV
jgi:hypothetical protein